MARNGRMMVQALVVAAGLAGGLAASASAREPDALAGPKVEQQVGSGQRFTPGPAAGEGRRERAAHMFENAGFMRALHWLGGPEAPADVKLSEQQRATVEAAVDKFHGRVEEYRQAHRAEVEALAADLPEELRERVLRRVEGGPGPRGMDGESGGGGSGSSRGKGAAKGDREGRPVLDEKAQAAMERIRAIGEAGPKPDELRAQVSALLTPAQREAVQARIDAQAKRAREAMDQRRGAGQDGPGRGARAERMREIMERLTPEQREKLREMTPEERREFLRNLRDAQTDGMMDDPR